MIFPVPARGEVPKTEGTLAMILLCSRIVESLHEGKKVFIYHLGLDVTVPQNRDYIASVFQFVTEKRLPDIDPGCHYSISRLPFVAPKKPSREERLAAKQARKVGLNGSQRKDIAGNQHRKEQRGEPRQSNVQ